MSKYVGWIPTLIGNLSYTLAGRSKYPSAPKVCIFEYKGTYHYIISQKRITHDSQMGLSALIPTKRLAREYEALRLKKRGIYSVWEPILIGSCSHIYENTSESNTQTIGKNFQNLQGQVIFIPRLPETKKVIRIINDAICKINDSLLDTKSNFSPEKALQVRRELEAGLNDIKKSKDREFTLLACDFNLQRNGICFLSNLEKLEKPLNSNNISFEKGNNQEYLNDNQAYNQIFYFLKDIFHAHKFHSPDYDTLTQTYKFDENDYVNWAKETLKDFFRIAIRIEPEESIGIIYYSRAFKDIIKQDKTLKAYSKVDNEDLLFNDGFSFLDKNSVSDEHAEDVCKARIDTRKRNLDSRKWQAGLFSTALLLIWNKSHKEIIELLGVTDGIRNLLIHFIVPIVIVWAFLVYVEKLSLSKMYQMIKFTKYLSSISKLSQIITLLVILIVGILSLFYTFIPGTFNLNQFFQSLL